MANEQDRVDDDAPLRSVYGAEVRTPMGLGESVQASYNPLKAATLSLAETRALDTSSPTMEPSHRVNSLAVPPVDPRELAAGFELHDILGRGGQGEVWQATQTRLGRPVAIKRIRPQLLERNNAADIIRAFRDEALTAARLEHPNIIPIYDYGVNEAGERIIAMKHVRGTSWDKMMAADFPSMRPGDFLAKHLTILQDVCQAVAFAHANGFVHRDLKPSQVMVGEFGETILMDWGLSVHVDSCVEGAVPVRREESEVPVASNPAGTPAYMAPEQTESGLQNIGYWTDVYLLGGILYQVVTGYPPRVVGSPKVAFRMAAEGKITPLSEAARGRPVPDELEELVMMALRPMGHDRIASAQVFRSRLEDYLTGSSRRHASEAETNLVREEVESKTLRKYPKFNAALARLSNAETMWSDNPDIEPLRAWVLESYARVALANGDLVLAKAQIKAMPAGSLRNELTTELEQQRERIDRQKQQLAMVRRLAVVLAVAMALGGAMFTWGLNESKKEALERKDEAEREKVRAEKAEVEATSELRYSSLLLAGSLMDQFRFEQARQLLWQLPEEARHWEWGVLLARAHEDLWTFDFECLSISPDASKGLVIEDGELWMRDLESGHRIRTVSRPDKTVMSVRFAENAPVLAMGFEDGTVGFESLDGSAAAKDIFLQPNPSAVDIAEDGRSVASLASHGRVAVADVAEGEVQTWESGLPAASDIRLFDNHFVAIWGANQFAMYDMQLRKQVQADKEADWNFLKDYAYSASTGRLLRMAQWTDTEFKDLDVPDASYIRLTGDDSSKMVMGPGGNEVLLLGRPGANMVYRMTDGAMAASLSVGFEVQGGTFCRRHSWVLVWGGSQAAVYDYITGDLINTLLGHSSDIVEGRFTSSGDRIVTTSTDGTTKVWDAREPGGNPSFYGRNPSLQDEDRFVVTLQDGFAALQDPQTGKALAPVGSSFGWFGWVAVSPDHRDALAHGRRGESIITERVDIDTDKVVSSVTWDYPANRPELSPSTEKILFFVGEVKEGFVHNSRTGELLSTLSLDDSPFFSVSWFPDSESVLASMENGDLAIFNAANGEIRTRWHSWSNAPLMVNHYGATGAFSTWDSDSGILSLHPMPNDPEARQQIEGSCKSYYFMPGDDRLVLINDNGQARVLRLSDRQVLGEFFTGPGQAGRAYSINGGSRIGVKFADNLRVWESDDWRQVVSIGPDFADLSADGEFMMFEEKFRATSRRPAPWRVDQLPGGAQTFPEGMNSWRRDRVVEWYMRRIMDEQSLRDELRALFNAIPEGQITEECIHILGEILERIPKGGPESLSLTQNTFTLDANIRARFFTPCDARRRVGYWQMASAEALMNEHRSALNETALAWMTATVIEYACIADNDTNPADPPNTEGPSTIAMLGRVLEAAGEKELAATFLTRWALRRKLVRNDVREYEVWIERLGGAPLPPVPPLYVWFHETQVAPIYYEEKNVGPDAKAETIRLQRELVDRLCPRPDYAALADEIRKAHPLPPMSDAELHALLASTIEGIVSIGLKGRGIDEFFEDERARLHEEVAGYEGR